MIKKTILSFLTLAMLLCVNVYAGDGKIIFSKSPISGETGETTFELGDKIYCKVFAEKALSEYTLLDHGMYKTDLKATGYQVKVYFDNFKGFDDPDPRNYKSGKSGLPLTTNCRYDDKDLAAKNTFEFVLNEENGDDSWAGGVGFNDELNKLSEGKHNVQIVVWAYTLTYHSISKKPIAVGNFELNKKAGSKIKLGKSFSDIVAKKSDSKIEAASLKALSEYPTSGKLAKPIVKLMASDWIIARNSSGLIEGRYLPGAYVVKNKDGSCQVRVNKFFQYYTGSGYQETIIVGVSIGDFFNTTEAVLVDCE